MSPERRLGSYELLSPLATGGMAEIYVAKTAGVSGFEKLLALKVIHPNYSSDPDFVQMLVDEAKLAVQLSHANIVQTFDLGQVDEQYYIAMELIDGADLYKVLRRSAEKNVDFPFDVTVFIAQEVCAGLDYAHRKCDSQGRPLEIVHRDVSPQNVLVSFDGEVKIVDFGIAKAAMRSQRTAAGVIKGKYFYMSPEQATGESIDARSDVFSAGILLYEMIVGQMLYLEEDLDKLLQLVRKAEIPPPSTKRPGVPVELEEIVMHALRKRKEERFQSAAEFGTALSRYLRRASPEFSRSKVATFVRHAIGIDETGRPQESVYKSQAGGLRDRHSLLFKLNAEALAPPRGRDSPTKGVLIPAPSRDFSEETEATVVESGLFTGAAKRRQPHKLDLAQSNPVLPASRGFLDDGPEETTAAMARKTAPGSQRVLTSDSDHDNEETQQRTLPSRALRATRELDPRSSVEIDDGPTANVPMGLGAIPPSSAPSKSNPAARSFDEPTVGPPLLSASATAPYGANFYDLESSAEPTAAPAAIPYSSPLAPIATRSPELPAFVSDALAPNSLGRRWAPLLIAGGALGIAVTTVLALWPESQVKCALTVVSSPSGASVRIDGTVLSKATPLEIHDLEPRTAHHVAVSLRGYEVWESDAKFDGDTRSLNLQAVLVPTVGSVEITSTPPGAEVIVNNRIGGVTPTTVGDLPPNEELRIELRLRGYKAASRHLSWGGKRKLSVTIPLEKAR